VCIRVCVRVCNTMYFMLYIHIDSAYEVLYMQYLYTCCIHNVKITGFSSPVKLFLSLVSGAGMVSTCT
jgi:hypothetical protein